MVFRECLGSHGIQAENADENLVMEHGRAQAASESGLESPCHLTKIQNWVRIQDRLFIRRDPTAEALAALDRQTFELIGMLTR